MGAAVNSFPHQYGDQVSCATGGGVAEQGGESAAAVCVVHAADARANMGQSA